MYTKPKHLHFRREKVFGEGPRVPLDREAKTRIKIYAQALKRRVAKGMHYGKLTGKCLDVLEAVVWLIHDSRTGQCNPSYETIADKAGCSRSTVGLALVQLEEVGLLSWVNRIKRVRVREEGLLGPIWVLKVERTSNAYVLHDPKGRRKPSTSDFPPRPTDVYKKTIREIVSHSFIHSQEGGAPWSGACARPQRALKRKLHSV